MTRHLPLILALAAAAICALTQPAAARSFDARTLAGLARVSDPRVSPDGKQVVYALRETDWVANRGVGSIWIGETRSTGREPRKLAASEGGAFAARWAPGGQWIYFLSTRSGSSQVWRTDPDGRAVVQVTALALDVGAFRVSPDGQALVVSAAVFPDCVEDEIACTRARLDARVRNPESGRSYDRLFVRHWDAWADGTRNHLFRVDLGGDAPRRTAAALTPGFDGDSPTKPFGDDADFVVTPDGEQLIFTARLAGRTEAWSTNLDLWIAPMRGGGAARNLTASNAAADMAPAISPDGGRLAYLAMKRPGLEADRLWVRELDLATGRSREVAPAWDRSPDKLAWSPDGRTLYATADDLGQKPLFAIDVGSGGVTPLTGPGQIESFDVAADGVVHASSSLVAPAQLFWRAGDGRGGAIRLTRHNAEVMNGVGLGAVERFSFKGWNGETVHGHLVRPSDFQPGRKYPTVFLIHGGPQSSYGNAWSYRWNPQTYAAAGYVVVFIDYHGSTGYGQAFTDAVSQHWGDRPLVDMQKGWAHVLERYPFVDSGRACALGPSVGGYFVYWLAGRWNAPWKCLVAHAGIFDTRDIGWSTDELWTTEQEFGGPAGEAGPGFDRFNPSQLAKDWRVPMLIVVGGRDYRVPEHQGLSAFSVLQRKGVPSRLLYFPDENHWVSKPHNTVQWHREVEDWLGRWIGEGPTVGGAAAAPG